MTLSNILYCCNNWSSTEHIPHALHLHPAFADLSESCSSMREPVDDLYLHNILRMSDRRGYGGQQKSTIVTLVDSVHRFEAY